MMAELTYWFQHCGRIYLPKLEDAGTSLSTTRGETYLPNTAKFVYNPHLSIGARPIAADHVNFGMRASARA